MRQYLKVCKGKKKEGNHILMGISITYDSKLEKLKLEDCSLKNKSRVKTFASPRVLRDIAQNRSVKIKADSPIGFLKKITHDLEASMIPYSIEL